MSAVLDRGELEKSPLADLHLLANELGVDGFRRLRKDDLIDAIVARQDDAPAEGGRAAPSRRRAEADEAATGRGAPRRPSEAAAGRGGRGRPRREDEGERAAPPRARAGGRGRGRARDRGGLDRRGRRRA